MLWRDSNHLRAHRNIQTFIHTKCETITTTEYIFSNLLLVTVKCFRRTKPACCWVHTRIGALVGQVSIIVPLDSISTNLTPGQPPAVSPPSSASSSWNLWCGGRTRRTSSLLTTMAALSSGTRRAENKQNRQIHPMALIPAR